MTSDLLVCKTCRRHLDIEPPDERVSHILCAHCGEALEWSSRGVRVATRLSRDHGDTIAQLRFLLAIKHRHSRGLPN